MKKLGYFKGEHLAYELRQVETTLNVLSEIGNKAFGTDFCIALKPGYPRFSEHPKGQVPVNYWVDEYDSTYDDLTGYGDESYYYVNDRGYLDHNIVRDYENTAEKTKNTAGIRPVMSLDDLPLNNVKKVNGFEILEYGEYPQNEAPLEIQKELDSLKAQHKLVRTGKKYTVELSGDDNTQIDEIIYKDKKYVYYNEKCYEVKPISWIVSRSDGIAFTRDVIVANVPANGVKDFLSDQLSKEILPTKEYLKNSNNVKQDNYFELELKPSEMAIKQKKEYLAEVNKYPVRILTQPDIDLIKDIPPCTFTDFSALSGFEYLYPSDKEAFIQIKGYDNNAMDLNGTNSIHIDRGVYRKKAGIRPVLVLDQFNNVTTKNGTLEYGEYPQTLVTDPNLISELDEAYLQGKLTGKEYAINVDNKYEYRKFTTSVHYLEELEYKGKKYVRMIPKEAWDKEDAVKEYQGDVVHYIEVEPIKWTVMKEHGIALADKVLMANVDNPSQYLNDYFIYDIDPNYKKKAVGTDKYYYIEAYQFRIPGVEYKDIIDLYEDKEIKEKDRKEFMIKEKTKEILSNYKHMLVNEYGEKKAKEIFEQTSKEVAKHLLKDALERNVWWREPLPCDLEYSDPNYYLKMIKGQSKVPVRVVSKKALKRGLKLIKKEKEITDEEKNTIKRLK